MPVQRERRLAGAGTQIEDGLRRQREKPQPFQQLGADRVSRDRDYGDGGHGLGLAIVWAIAIAHRASLSARARPGGGLEIKVDFDRVMAG